MQTFFQLKLGKISKPTYTYGLFEFNVTIDNSAGISLGLTKIIFFDYADNIKEKVFVTDGIYNPPFLHSWTGRDVYDKFCRKEFKHSCYIGAGCYKNVCWIYCDYEDKEVCTAKACKDCPIASCEDHTNCFNHWRCHSWTCDDISEYF